MTTIERLHAERARIEASIEALEREKLEIDLALAEIHGDALRAAYLRARLSGTRDEEHAAWVRVMAAHYIALGTHGGDASRAEVEAEAARMRAEASHGA